MGLFDNLQATQRAVLRKLAGLAGYEDKEEVDVKAQNMLGVLGAALMDGRVDIPMGMNWVAGVATSGAVDGTPLAIFSGGASTVPGLTLANEKIGIRWNNHATPDPIGTTFTVPADMDCTQASTLYLLAHKVGATVGDAVTWTVTAFSTGDADLADADANFGGASSAMTGDAATKTMQLESLTLAADTMDNGDQVSITVQPTDGTLGTDDVVLCAVYLSYKKKLA